MRAASGFEPRTKRLETRALVGSATREALSLKAVFILINETCFSLFTFCCEMKPVSSLFELGISENKERIAFIFYLLTKVIYSPNYEAITMKI